MDLEEHSGTEENDIELLKKALVIDSQEDSKQYAIINFHKLCNCTISIIFILGLLIINFDILLRINFYAP